MSTDKVKDAIRNMVTTFKKYNVRYVLGDVYIAFSLNDIYSALCREAKNRMGDVRCIRGSDSYTITMPVSSDLTVVESVLRDLTRLSHRVHPDYTALKVGDVYYVAMILYDSDVANAFRTDYTTVEVNKLGSEAWVKVKFITE